MSEEHNVRRRRDLVVPGSRGGSALLVTVLAVSLLTIIVLTFTILVRMELRAVLNQHALMRARANARLGGELAVSMLQERAGPDQRVTLPAWADAGVSASVPAQNQYFTGVRDAEEFRYQADASTPGAFVAQPNPAYGQHQGWLVSRGDVLNITNYTPFQVSGGSWRVSDDSVLVVGPGAVTTNLLENGIPAGFVAVPREFVLGSSSRVSGQYAFWVSDEATKARLNTFDEFRGTATNAWSLLMAQRAAPEVALPDYDASDPTHQAVIQRVHSDPQWNLANSALDVGASSAQPYRDLFHGISSTSMGLPVNVKRGGFKRDLSAVAQALATNVPVGKVDTTSSLYQELLGFHRQRVEENMAASLWYQGQGDFLTPAQRGLPLRRGQITASFHKVFPPSSYYGGSGAVPSYDGDPGGPQWRQLLEFMTLGDRDLEPANGTLAASEQSDLAGGAFPVLNRFHMRMAFTLTARGKEWIIRKHIIPNVALWNPYDVPITIPKTYFVAGFDFSHSGGDALHMKVRHDDWHEPGEAYWMPPHQMIVRAQGDKGGFFYAGKFPVPLLIPSTTFQPGETLWFELDAHHKLEFESGSGGDRGGGFSWFPGADGSLANLDVSYIQNDDHYYPMHVGLDPAGSRSLYLEENLTWRTMTEAGGYAKRPRSDWGGAPTAYASYNMNVSTQFYPDVPSGYLWDGGQWKSPWAGNPNNHPSGIPRYPTTFDYSTLDDPAVRTYTFPTYTSGSKTGWTVGSLSGLNQFPLEGPGRAPLDVVNVTLAPGFGNPKVWLPVPRYNRWLLREDSPHGWPDRWKNKKQFPVRYNENGLIYSFSPEDTPVPEDIAVDLHGITTDWEIEEIRLGLGHPSYRARKTGSDWVQNDLGQGIIVFGTDYSKWALLGGSGEHRPAYAAMNLYGIWPSDRTGNPYDKDDHTGDPQHDDFTGPRWNSLPSWNGSDGFIEGVNGDSFGILYALRVPDHEIDGDERLTFQIPWLTGYNPTSNFMAADPLYGSDEGQMKKIGSTAPLSLIGGVTYDSTLLDPQALTPNERNGFVGHSGRVGPSDVNRASYSVLKAIPRSFEELVSIGQFMHANPISYGNASGASDVGHIFAVIKDGLRMLGGELAPTYAVGGGRVSPLIPSELPFRLAWSENTAYPPGDVVPQVFSQRDAVETGVIANASYHKHEINGDLAYQFFPLYDLSFYLNNALWDDYMFTGRANSRLRWKNGIVDRDFDLSASRVLVEGAFNVNSVSVGAWASILMSFLDLSVDPQDSSLGDAFDGSERVPLARTMRPMGGSYSAIDGNDFTSATMYEGYRRLTRNDIWDPDNNSGLAVEIVNAVRERGPFYSLADFVNRDPSSPTLEYRMKGALQMAIDRAGLNGEAKGIWDSGDTTSVITPDDYSATHPDGTPWQYNQITENLQNLPANAGAAATLNQEDLLAKIGGFIQVRGDTFKVRAYGNTYNEQTGAMDAQAWCEIIVQRQGDYISPATADTADPDGVDTPEELPDELSALNRSFGRRYEIIRFRWLSADEL